LKSVDDNDALRRPAIDLYIWLIVACITRSRRGCRMNSTHCLAIVFAVAGLGAAIVAAIYWWKASRVPIQTAAASISDVPELHIMSGHTAFYESSQLNSRAAIFTGIAAVLSAIGSVLGVL
jgi:hypothetical protein